MKYIIKCEKGYVSYVSRGEIAYTTFRDDAKVYSSDLIVNGALRRIRMIDATARKVVK